MLHGDARLRKNAGERKLARTSDKRQARPATPRKQRPSPPVAARKTKSPNIKSPNEVTRHDAPSIDRSGEGRARKGLRAVFELQGRRGARDERRQGFPRLQRRECVVRAVQLRGAHRIVLGARGGLPAWRVRGDRRRRRDRRADRAVRRVPAGDDRARQADARSRAGEHGGRRARDERGRPAARRVPPGAAYRNRSARRRR